MNHGSLFSGVGGFDLPAQWMGWKNIFHCEIEPFGRQVLNYYWPESIGYGDIKQTDFTIHKGQIDVLSGGFPCQPYSTAGKRLGKEDSRHLWPEMCRAIREIKPTWVVGENVYGLVNWSKGLVFEEVQADLEKEGYTVQPYIIPACGKNAPHRRDRVWFVGYAEHYGSPTSKIRGDEQEPPFQTREDKIRESKGTDSSQSSINTVPTNPRIESMREQENSVYGSKVIRHSSEFRRNEKEIKKEGQRSESVGISDSENDSNNERDDCIRKWEYFPTQPPVCSRNDGLPSGLAGITVSKHRIESIKAYGNAIVPQIAYEIFQTIQEYTENLK